MTGFDLPPILPSSVLDLVEFRPSEDILLAILRAGLPDIPVVSLIANDPPARFIVTRRVPGFAQWVGDERFVDIARFYVHTFTADPDGDEEGALLSEAVRVVLRNASHAQPTFPGLGSIVRIVMNTEPHRETDWAPSAGPVQYADLPTGTWRYAAQYTMTVRKPR